MAKLNNCLSKLSGMLSKDERTEIENAADGNDAAAIDYVTQQIAIARSELADVTKQIADAQKPKEEPAPERELRVGAWTPYVDVSAKPEREVDPASVREVDMEFDDLPAVIRDVNQGESPGPRGRRAIASAIKEALRLGVPASVWDGVRSFYIKFGNMGGEYNIETGSIGVTEDLLVGQASGDTTRGSLTVGTLVHEVGHHVARDADGNAFVTESPALAVTWDGKRRIPTGPVIAETTDAFLKNGPLTSYLRYPMRFWTTPSLKGMDTDTTTLVLQDEVFAQLFRLYFTNPKLMKRELPLGYSLIQEAVNGIRAESGTGIDGTRRAVRGALRSWTAGQPGGVDRGGDRAAQAGARDGGAGTGVGVGERVQPQGRPQDLEHRYGGEGGRGGAGSAPRGEPGRSAVDRGSPGSVDQPRGVRPQLGSLAGEPVNIRPKQPDAITVVGVHYSPRGGIDTLAGNMYGSSTSQYAGEEFARVQSADRRVRNRVYFYAMQGGTVPAAEGVVTGQHLYTATLSNILDLYSKSGQDIIRQSRVGGKIDHNKFELAVIEAGYDGYFDPSFNREGAVVVLDANVPVSYIGTRGNVKSPANLEVQAGERKPATLDDFKPGKVKGIRRKGDWALITAENPNAKQLSPAMNAARNARLERDMKKMGVTFEKVTGKYGGNDENSYAVVGITQEQAEQLRDKYDQDSVLTRDGLLHADGSVTPATGVTEHTTAPQDFFSRMSSGAMFTVDLNFDKRTKPTKPPKDIEKYLTQEEIDRLKQGTGRVSKLVDVMKELPPTKDFEHAALAGIAAKGWYERSRAAVEAVYGSDSPRFIALMAALSPQTDVESNFYNTAKVWHAWERANRTIDPERIKRILTQQLVTGKGQEDGKNAMEAWAQNSIRTLTSSFPEKVVLSGPKVESFRRNLMGDLYEVTNDRHNAAFAGIDQSLFGGNKAAGDLVSGKGPGYIAFNVRMRQAAANLTKATGERWTPAEAQETLWSFWKALYDLTTAKGETRSAVELLRAGALTHEMVRLVPDLGSFFNEEQYRKIAGRDVGEDVARARREQEGSVQGAARQTGPIAATPATERIARRADRLIEARRRLEQLNAEIKAQNEQLDEAGIAQARERDELINEIANIEAEVESGGLDDIPFPKGPANLNLETEPPLWESGLAKNIVKAPFAKDGTISVGQLKMWAAARSKDGTLKPEELKWVGFNDWLDALIESDIKKLSRDEVVNFVEDNAVRVEETLLGDRPLPPGFTLDPLEDGSGFTMSGAGVSATGQTEAEAATFLAGRMERIAQQWQKNGDPGKAARYFMRAEGLTAWAEFAEGWGSGEETKYHGWQTPGGKGYKELLLTLPVKPENAARYDLPADHTVYQPDPDNYPNKWRHEDGQGNQIGPDFGVIPNTVAAAVKFAADRMHGGGKPNSQPGAFRSQHFDQPNILAHVRFNERTTTDGKRVLFVEEFQSDWAQKGRKEGFATKANGEVRESRVVPGKFMVWVNGNPVVDGLPTREIAEAELKIALKADHNKGIPEAPFVGKTEAWVKLAVKRMVRYAADNGFDAIAWTTGEQQAERYDLSKTISSAFVTQTDPRGLYAIGIKDKNTGELSTVATDVNLSKLDDYIGKELAEKARDHFASGSKRKSVEYSGLDLKVGGEGMKGFYDNILPNVVNKTLKEMKVGGSIGALEMGEGGYGTMRVIGKGWRIVNAKNDVVTDKSFKDQQDALRWIAENDPSRKQPGVVLTQEGAAKAKQPQNLFLENVITGDSGRQYTPEQKALFENVGRTVGKQSLKEKVADLWKDAGKKMAQGLVDQFAPIKDLSTQAYALARLSKGASGAFEALLRFGKLKLRDGVYDVDTSGGVIEKVFAPLQGEGEDFLWWVAANRAERLSAEDREHLFTPADIAAGKSLASGQTGFDYTLQNGPNRGQVTRDRAAIFADALKSFDAFNRNVMDMAEQSGLVDGTSRQFWEREFYVPFYRVAEDDNVRGLNIKSGLVRQEAFKRLKGGTEKINSDLLANTLRNWAHLIDASAKNRAAKATLEAAERLGVAVEAPEDTVRQMSRSMGMRKNVAWFVDGGQQRYYLVEDPYVLTAINGLEFAGMRGPLMDAMSTFKHWLTIGVTASPFFKVRNLIRDSVQAIAVSGLSYNPLMNVKEGFEAGNHQGQMYASILASGGVIHFGTMLESREADRVRQLVKTGVKDSTILDSESKLRRFYDTKIEPAIIAYNELGNRSEEVNRVALYKQLMAQGMSHAEASLLARDLMDFSMQGAWTGIRFLTQTVPFLNARMQGLYKLGRGISEDPRKAAVVLGATALASIALLLAYKDDDDWKKREDWDRDGFWWFKLGGTAFRIPKPFEIGSMASVAERGLELMISDEMNGKRFGDRMLALLADNLAMNPVPQLLKPVIDIYANKDSFTGRPIEGMGMERLQPEARFNQRTSMLARAASIAGNAATGVVGKQFLSPVQIDHLIRGYFGWLGTFAVAGADMVARPASDQPTRPTADYTKVLSGGLAASLPTPDSRYVTDLYEQAKTIEQAHATWRDMLSKGDTVRAQAFAQQNIDLLKRYGLVERVKRAQSEMNKRIRQIEVDPGMSPDEKRDAIQRLQDQKNRSAKLLAAGLGHRAV